MSELDSDILSCLTVLRAGGVILYPSDLGWTLGCDATDPNAVSTIHSMLQGSNRHEMLVLVTEEQDVLKHVAAPDLAAFDFLTTGEAPAAIRYDGVIGLADNLIRTDGSVDICITAHPLSRHLIKRLGNPLACCTGLNLEGLQDSGIDYVVASPINSPVASHTIAVFRWVSGQPVPVGQ